MAGESEAKVVDLNWIDRDEHAGSGAGQDKASGSSSGQSSGNGTREDKVGPQSPPPTPLATTSSAQPQQNSQQLQPQPQPQPQEQQAVKSPLLPLPRFLSPRKVAMSFMEGPNSPAPQTICSPCTEGAVAATPPTAAAALLKGSLTRGKMPSLLSSTGQQPMMVDLSPLFNVDRSVRNVSNSDQQGRGQEEDNQQQPYTFLIPRLVDAEVRSPRLEPAATTTTTTITITTTSADVIAVAKKYHLTNAEAVATVRTIVLSYYRIDTLVNYRLRASKQC